MRRLLSPLRARRGGRRRSGQVLIFLAMVLVILAFVVLWQFDLHKTLFVKARSRNAGDAAAVAAARWQGVTLNLIGELNVMQAIAITEALARGATNFPEAEAIGDLKARLCFVGPMVGFANAQLAAKHNGMYRNEVYERELRDHARNVRRDYPVAYPDRPYENDPPVPTAWDDYADMIEAIADMGVAAACDNMHFYTDYVNSNHLLLNPGFYDAIASRDWCWFLHNALPWLEGYTSWMDWPPLPRIIESQPMNAEFFGLGLRKVMYLASIVRPHGGPRAPTEAELIDAIRRYADGPVDEEVVDVPVFWHCFNEFIWRPWTELIPENFPFESDPKPEYNYAGADAAVRLETRTDRRTPGIASADITWSAAAKPFGALDGPTLPTAYTLVLPAFTDVRLIPIDTSTAPSGGSRPGWAIHIRYHLPVYVAQGLAGLDGSCWYCNQLRTWEDASFRADGLAWLREHSKECIVHGGGGGGGGGGGRRGH